ncbi:hypothetical protein [Salinifilum ghardaiensis]
MRESEDSRERESGREPQDRDPAGSRGTGRSGATVRWHAYVEVRDELGLEEASTRADRLARTPEAVFTTPEQAARWVAEETAQRLVPRAVHLFGSEGGTGELGDEAHRRRDYRRNLDVLERGDSLYYEFPSNGESVRLWLEAIHSVAAVRLHPDGQSESSPPSTP